MDRLMKWLIPRLPGKLKRILKYGGKYDGNADRLPNQDLPDGAVPFDEPPLNKFMLMASITSVGILAATFAIYYLRTGHEVFTLLGIIIACILQVPHEFLHAVCYNEEVWMYSYLHKGALFVVSGEHISKRRFIFMSLLPNIAFGFIPFLLFLIFPGLKTIGTIGAFCIATGIGDYINAYNALTQMPNDAKTFLYKDHSYWIRENENDPAGDRMMPLPNNWLRYTQKKD